MISKAFRSLLLIAPLSLCAVSYASLIGDTITFTHYLPAIGTAFSAPSNVVVQAGPADAVTPIFQYTVNPEANGFLISFNGNGGFTTQAFNGLGISGINDTITGLSVSTNLAGWSDSRATFDSSSVYLNFQNLPFVGTGPLASFLNVTLTTAVPTQNVPEGGASVAMMGAGLVGLLGVRRLVSLRLRK